MSGYRGYGHQMGPRARFRSARYRRGGFRRHRPRAQKPIISLSLRFRDELKLNEEQIDKLENLRSDFIRRMIGERAALRTLRFDIRQALRADKVDVSAAEKLVRGAAKKRADIALDRIRTIEKGKALLTEEQFKELKTLTSRRGRGRWGGRDRYGAMMREHHDEMEREHHGDSQQGPPGKSESGKGKSGKSGPGKGKKF
jgi:Spy/CpxP family protein refolding chaperone